MFDQIKIQHNISTCVNKGIKIKMKEILVKKMNNG